MRDHLVAALRAYVPQIVDVVAIDSDRFLLSFIAESIQPPNGEGVPR